MKRRPIVIIALVVLALLLAIPMASRNFDFVRFLQELHDG